MQPTQPSTREESAGLPSNAGLFAISAALLLLFLFLAGAAYVSGRAVERASRLISIDAVPGWQLASSMRLSISVSARACVEAVVTSDADKIPAKLAEARAADAAFRETLTRYETTSHIAPEADHRLLLALRERYEVFDGKRKAFSALAETGRRPEALAIFEHELIPAFGAVIREAEKLIQFNQNNAFSLTHSIVGDIGTLRATVLVVVGLATICVVVLVFTFLSRREAQRTLSASERRLRHTLDNLVVFAGLCEPDGTVVEANQTALTAAGIRREEVIGRHFPDLPWWAHSAEARAKVCAAIADAAQGKATRFDTDNRIAGGGLITVDFSCGPIRDASGRVTHLVLSGIDITERKNLEAQFIKAQRLEIVGTLSAGLAHDLNNILAPLLMAPGFLRDKLSAPEDRKILDMIESSAQRGARIIRQLLSFGRGTDGQRSRMDLRHLLTDVAHIVEETFPRRIVLHSDIPAGLWTVNGDPTQLHQVLLNLCVNARDAMPSGGSLTLSAANTELDEAAARIHAEAKPGRHIRLRVTDTGEGIPRENLERIFDPFFTTKEPGKGTGLGLFSVLGIVRNHGGFMTVDSAPGRGTTFDVYLPAHEGEIATPGSATEGAAPRGDGDLLLLVDNEFSVREAARKALGSHGYQVLCAVNGADAVRLYLSNQDRIRAVITDLDMPVMGGVELVRSLRLVTPGVRCIVLTGSIDPQIRADLIALKADDLLEKPCSTARLLKSVHAVLAAPPH